MSKDIAVVTRQDFVAAITAIEDQGKLGAAADLRKFSRTFCEWAVNRGLATANVMAGLRKPKQTRAEKLAAEARRARALNDAEIIAVWTACTGRGSFGNLVRLLLLSGARLGEIAKLTRNQILSDRLVLPPLSTKSGEKHEVPLTELMRNVLAAQPTTLSEFAFPSEKTGRPIAGWNRPVVALRIASGVDFTLHDLRRTCRTLMSQHRVEFEVAELAIGHKRTGLARLYDFAELWEAPATPSPRFPTTSPNSSTAPPRKARSSPSGRGPRPRSPVTRPLPPPDCFAFLKNGAQAPRQKSLNGTPL